MIDERKLRRGISGFGLCHIMIHTSLTSASRWRHSKRGRVWRVFCLRSSKADRAIHRAVLIFEFGWFVLWHMNHDMWYIEFILGVSKIFFGYYTFFQINFLIIG